jgi:hypothetical protein
MDNRDSRFQQVGSDLISSFVTQLHFNALDEKRSSSASLLHCVTILLGDRSATGIRFLIHGRTHARNRDEFRKHAEE